MRKHPTINEKRKTNSVKDASSLCTPKSSAEASGNSAENIQSLYRKEECTIVEGPLLTVKNSTKWETSRYVVNIP